MIAVARQLVASFRFLVMMTVLLGVAYPGVITLAAQALPTQANGSLLSDSQGRVVGSALMGQAFEGPQWFQARPSASDYAGAVSGGSNLSPDSDAQRLARADREAVLRHANPAADAPVPEDALTASASGLDPHISVEYALWQLPRVAAARRMGHDELRALVNACTDEAPLGFLGQDAVNTTRLNLALADR